MNKKTLSERAYRLHLSAASLANGIRNGMFRSLFHGQGVDFNGVRDYFRGDDVRRIDWNVTARMGKPFVKMFEEDRELDVFMIVDKSLSMETGSVKRTRLETACECAALLTMASFQNACPVGAVTFDGKIEFSAPPKSGKEHLMLLLTQFEKMSADKQKGSSLENALTGAIKLLRKRTLVIVISDFRTEGWSNAFAELCSKNDVVAIRIADPLDEKLPEVGSVMFTDPETGYAAVLPSGSKEFVKAWIAANNKRVDVWKKECLRHGGVPFTVSTEDDCAEVLIKFFSSREKR